MAQYDGTIRIATKITTKDATESLASLEWTIKKSAKYMDELRSKMDALKDQKIPTQEYKNLQEKLVVAKEELSSLVAEQEKYSELGVASGGAWDTLNEKVATASDKVDLIKEKMQSLSDAGKDFVLGKDTEQYAAYVRQLRYEEESIVKAGEHYNKLINKTKENYKKLGNTAKKSSGFFGTMGARFKSLALSLLIFNQVSKAFNAFISGVKEGFDNFYNGNEKFKNSIDGLKASMLTLKNSFAAAFAPLVEIAIPYIQKAVEWITRLVDIVGQFIVAASGQKTYTKAVKQTADAFKKAEKSAEGYLSPLDEINKYQSKDDKDDSEKAEAMFEEVPIDTGVLDFLQKIKDFLKPIIDYAQKLKDVFMQGFWDGLGDWQYRWDSIKNSISFIKESLIDIFTDPNVVGAADNWSQSVAYMLGSFAGSVASIGLTIATNLLGGISKYLEQNKERIKGYLVSMFDIWSEINYLFADLFQSIAYVFEAFASEQGQQLTANIIGIFADAFMGITELVSKLFRDIAQIIIKLFVDNKEAFRTALEGFLGVLAEVTGTIKQGIDDTFDKLNEVYDEHFKPFFDSIADGLSDTVGKLLEMWNTHMQPILDRWAEKFDVLWSEHIQPMLNNFMELLGSLSDLLKWFWEEVLKPQLDWFITVLGPAIGDICDFIVSIVDAAISSIADLINGVIKVVKGVIDILFGLFTGDWKNVWKGFTDVVDGANTFIKGIINSMIGFIESLANAVVAVVNTIIRVFNSLNFDVPDWIPGIGGKSIGFNIPELSNVSIPRLATGAVIPANREFLAVLGDQKHGTNIEAPLDTIKQAQRESILEVLSELGLTGNKGNNNPQTLIIKQYLDGKQVAESVVKEGKIQQMSTGSNMFLLGTT